MSSKTFLQLPKDKQTRILDAALAQFNTLGFDQVSVSSLVKESGIPRGSFYMYFDDLEDVYQHLLSVVGETKMHYMAPVMARLEEASFLALYPDIVAYGIAFAKDHPEYYVLGLQLYRSHTPGIRRLKEAMEQQGLAFMTQALMRDQERGFLKQGISVTLLANMLYRFNAMELLERFYQGESPESLIELTKEMMTLLTQGVGGNHA